ncbi:MAG: type II toxin-antitoxin system RelB/DinJ family antitoxin [Pleomorphochaeta sp.]
MNNKASITVRTDIQAKKDAQRILSSLGLDMSTAINIFLRQVIQEEGLPFKVVLKQPNCFRQVKNTPSFNSKKVHYFVPFSHAIVSSYL